MQAWKILHIYISFNNNWDSLFKTYLMRLKHILWCLWVNFLNWNMWKVFSFSPIISKKDWRANFWIKRFNAPGFFKCARVTLNRKSVWHGLTRQIECKQQIQNRNRLCDPKQILLNDQLKMSICWPAI